MMESVLVYDASGEGTSPVQGLLDTAWSTGGWFFHATGRFSAVVPARTWAEAFDALLARPEPPGEVQFWGHGRPGRVLVGRDVLERDALENPLHPLYPRLQHLAARDRGHVQLWWFRCCSTFEGPDGASFARAWAGHFQTGVAGHTAVIGVIQPGLCVLPDATAPFSPLPTVSFLRQELPSDRWARRV